MKASTAIGILIALAGLVVGAVLEGAPLTAFLNLPAALIVFGGTLGVTIASVGPRQVQSIPRLYRKVFTAAPVDVERRRQVLVGLADKARRKGLLSLEADVEALDDAFARTGLQLVVDGADPAVVRDILEAEIDGMSVRHAAGADTFHKAGGYSPTLGIIGTVMGLVHVLDQLGQPDTLGPAISGAFIATLYGVGAANVLYLPVASRLRALSTAETELHTTTLEGILSIQAGDNPRVVGDKLAAFIAPADRTDPQAETGAPASTPAEPVAVAA